MVKTQTSKNLIKVVCISECVNSIENFQLALYQWA